jgi:hypothetical protein
MHKFLRKYAGGNFESSLSWDNTMSNYKIKNIKFKYYISMICSLIYRQIISFSYIFKCEYVFTDYSEDTRFFNLMTLNLKDFPVLGPAYRDILFNIYNVIKTNYTDKNLHIDYRLDHLSINNIFDNTIIHLEAIVKPKFFVKDIKFIISVRYFKKFKHGENDEKTGTHTWCVDTLSNRNSIMIYKTFKNLIQMYNIDTTK